MENITSETLKKEYKEMGPVAYWTLYGRVRPSIQNPEQNSGASHDD